MLLIQLTCSVLQCTSEHACLMAHADDTLVYEFSYIKSEPSEDSHWASAVKERPKLKFHVLFFVSGPGQP